MLHKERLASRSVLVLKYSRLFSTNVKYFYLPQQSLAMIGGFWIHNLCQSNRGTRKSNKGSRQTWKWSTLKNQHCIQWALWGHNALSTCARKSGSRLTFTAYSFPVERSRQVWTDDTAPFPRQSPHNSYTSASSQRKAWKMTTGPKQPEFHSIKEKK